MVSCLSIVFCSLFLIALLLQNQQCTAEQQLAEPNLDLNSEDAYDDTEKRGGGRAFSGIKRAGGRNFANFAPMADKRGGGRGFNFYDSGFAPLSDKRGGGRAFIGYGGGSYLNYPLIYKKALAYEPYYFQYANKRGGGRAFSGYVNEEQDQRQKRAGGRSR